MNFWKALGIGIALGEARRIDDRIDKLEKNVHGDQRSSYSTSESIARISASLASLDDVTPGKLYPFVEGQPDPLYDQAVELVVQRQSASVAFLQRELGVGYNRAARLLEEMEKNHLFN